MRRVICLLSFIFLLISVVSACDEYISTCRGYMDPLREAKTYCLTQDVTGWGNCFYSRVNATLDCQGHKISIPSGPEYFPTIKGLKAVKNCEIIGPGKDRGVGVERVLIVENTTIRNFTLCVAWDVVNVSNSIIESCNRCVYANWIFNTTIRYCDIGVRGWNTYIGNSLIESNKVGVIAEVNTFIENCIIRYNSDYGLDAIYYSNTIKDSILINYRNFECDVTEPITPIHNYWGHPLKIGYSDTCLDVDADGICDKPYRPCPPDVFCASDEKPMSRIAMIPPNLLSTVITLPFAVLILFSIGVLIWKLI